MVDYDRARSFIERYVIARAGHFRIEHEEEDVWACTQVAKSAYRMIADVSQHAEPPDPFANQATQGGMGPGPAPTQAPLTPASQQGHGMIAGNNGMTLHNGPGGGFAQAHTALMRQRAAQQTKPPGPLTRAFRALNLKGEPV